MNNVLRLLDNLFRPLARKPGFAIALIAILALGIGINVATLGLLYRYYVAPLPYAQGSRLVKVYFAAKDPTLAKMQRMSVPTWLALQKDAPALSSSGIYEGQGYNLTLGKRELRLNGIAASASVFTTLGVHPLLGRLFGPQSMESGSQPVVVLSYGLWQTLFQGNAAALGRTLHLNGQLFTVIGVMPKDFNFPSSVAVLWTPLVLSGAARNPYNLTSFRVQMIGRLAAGASLSALLAQSDTVIQGQIAGLPAANAVGLLQKQGFHVEAETWRATQTANLHESLILVFCATLLLMLLAWFNLANLCLTRSITRRSEFALRRTLGATSRGLVASIACENLTLSFAGALGGIVLGRFLIMLFSQSLVGQSASAIGSASWPALIAIAVLLALLSAALFTFAGLGPVRSENLALTLRGADAHASEGHRTKRMRRGLIAGQIALACAIVGSGLLLGRGLLNLSTVRLGFQPSHVTTFRFTFPASQYSTDQVNTALARLLSTIEHSAGVQSAALTSDVPFDGGEGGSVTFPRPWNPSAHPTAPVSFQNYSSGDYFKTFGMPLLAGRGFLPSDTQSGTSVVIIDTLAAKQLFGSENVIGREFSYFSPHDKHLYRVIGVVPTVIRADLGSTPPMGNVYMDYDQLVAQNPQNNSNYDWYLAVLSSRSKPAIVPSVRAAAQSIIPGVPLYDIQTMDQRVAASLASNRLLTALVLLFAVGALVLAAVGLYALQAYSVAQRSREFAIRVALGASQSRVIAQVLGETARLLVIGLVVGLAGLAAIGVAFASAFYGIGAVDPVSMVIVIMVLALAALAASWIPAWRASRIAPAEALRDA